MIDIGRCAEYNLEHVFYSLDKRWFQFTIALFAILVAGCAQPLPLQRPTAISPNTATSQITVVAGADTLVPEATTGGAETVVPAPTAPITATEVATPASAVGTPIVIIPSTAVALSGEAAWQAQQANREDFGGERQYRANAPTSLFWFDPATGQNLEIGRLVGGFVATAQFELRSQNNARALAVPYRINADYGLTAISPAVQARMEAAGYTDRVEAFVLLGDSVVPIN